MGDIVEISRGASHPLLFYKTSSNGMWFDIKTHNRALVGLAMHANGGIQHWIEICNPGILSISETSTARREIKTGLPFTLSQDNYCRFWVVWDSKFAWVGIGNNWDIIVSSPVKTKLNYITFTTKDHSNPCSFKFEVPPLCLRVPSIPDEPKITAGKLHWKPCDDQLPDEAVIGGYIDGETVYIVRARHRQSLTPGVFVPSKGLAYIPWGGSDNPTSTFEALCGINLKWKPASENPEFVSADAFIAGYSEVNHEPLYIGRGLDQNNKIPGKVQLSHRACYIAHQGKEVSVKNFEILTEPGLNVHCDNEGFRLIPPPEYVDNADDDIADYAYVNQL